MLISAPKMDFVCQKKKKVVKFGIRMSGIELKGGGNDNDIGGTKRSCFNETIGLQGSEKYETG